MQRALILGVLTVVLLLPRNAVAAIAGVGPVTDPLGRSWVVFDASPGETNRVVVSFDKLGLTITDYGAVAIVPGAGCTPSVDAHSVWCPSVYAAQLDLGDRNDSLHAVTPLRRCCLEPVVAGTGGPGDDALRVARGSRRAEVRISARFDGGGGSDRLYGGHGDDSFTDGDRDDAAEAVAPNRDVIDGGSDWGGGDTVSYEHRDKRVSVNLATERGPEGDRLKGLEHVQGGSGDDRLVGTDAGSPPQRLNGGPGRDVIDARGGTDYIYPGRHGAIVTCGSGEDFLFFQTSRPAVRFVEPGCELVLFPTQSASAYPRLTKRSFRYRVGCNVIPGAGPDGEVDPEYRCGGSIKLREASNRRRSLASGIIPQSHGALEESVRMRFTPLGRRLASKDNGVRAAVRIEPQPGFTASGAGRFPPVTWIIRLKLPT